MKRILFLLGISVLAVAACQIVDVETNVETPAVDNTPHLTVNFNITSGDEPATKAVKTSWENGDAIYFFFDDVMDAEYLMMLYVGGKWNPYWSKGNYSLEEAVASRGSGTVSGIYVFGRHATELGVWSEDYKDLAFYLDEITTKQQKAYTWFLTCDDVPYTVVGNELTATINMTMPAEYDFVRFTIPNLDGDAGRFVLMTSPVINSVTPYRIDKNEGFLARANINNQMPGIPYSYHDQVFSGVLSGSTKDITQDYTFTLLNTENGASYRYSVSGKTLSRGKSIKLPAFDSGSWSALSPGAASPKYVDLGLPSGIKWATFNVGATIPEEYGSIYPWGHIAPEMGDLAAWSDYRFYSSGSDDYDVTFIKYYDGGLTSLALEDDAANSHPAWGGNWRIPTPDDWAELLTYCSVATESMNGTYGNRITSMVSGYEHEYIFLPMNWYWTNKLDSGTPNSISASIVISDYGEVTPSNGKRYYALAVRPVYDSAGGGLNAVPMGELNGDVLYVADRNLGAASPEDAGKYYAWGDTNGYTSSEGHYFNDVNYVFNVGGEYDKFSKYVKSGQAQYWGVAGDPDNITVLDAVDDAAAAELGGDWHIPTSMEMNYLTSNCDWVWDAVRSGYTVTGRGVYSANSIFIPAAGHCNSSLSNYGVQGFYWTTSLSPGNSYNAYILRFDINGQYFSDEGRICGAPIRSVKLN